MTLSEFSIKNPVFAWMLMAAMILFGGLALSRMGISELPDIDYPIISVSLTYDGAAPEIMEIDVVDPIEESLLTLEGIKHISSSSSQDRATITIEFDINRDIDLALQDVQNRIAQIQNRLPEDLDPPIVLKTNPEDQPIMWVSLSADLPPREVMTFARDRIKDQLQTVGGVGEVIFGGYIEPNLRVWLDPNALNRWELTVIDVINAIQSEHVEVPAGRLETPEKEKNIRSFGEATTPEQFEKIEIRRRGGNPIYRPLYIGNVAKVEKGLADIRRISRTNGKSAIGLGIKKQRGSNAVEVAHGIKEALAKLQKQIPKEYTLAVNFDATRFIEATNSEMKRTLGEAALLTAIICLLFLASWGSTFNILLAIPTSILGSFLFLYFFGFTLNTFTMLGLILAVGIVVDDAIMVLENIFRHKEMGKSSIQAARDGAKEVTSAAVATTLALIAIFIPVVFMTGIIGKYFFQFGVTMSVAVALSLVEALTLTPMRASRMIGSKHQEGRFAKIVNRIFEAWRRWYKSLLEICLNWRWAVILLTTLFFAGSLTLYPGLKKEFVPPQDQSVFLVLGQTPIGSSLHFTDEKFKQAEAIVAKFPEVVRYYAAVGGFGGETANRGLIFITLKQPKDRPIDPATGKRRSQQQIMDDIRPALSKISDFRIVLQDLSSRGFGSGRGFAIEFTVRGPNWEKLTELTNDLKKKMEGNKFFTDVDTDYEFGQPEIQVLPLRLEAAARGVSTEEIGKTVQAMFGGIEVGKFTEGGRRNDIRLRLAEEGRQSSNDLKKLYVRNNQGEMIPISQVVQIQEKVSLKSITRQDRERSIKITANVGKGQSQDLSLKEVNRLAAETLPEGYRIVYTGSAETFKESFQSLFFALYFGIIVAYMILASQYNSFIHPLTVLLALPFSISGAIIALYLSGDSINVFSLIGLILLMGIVKKNSILLVDFTNQRRREGMETREALLIACPQRLRPIMMTSFATIASAIPAAIALGAGAETRVPMGVVVIGGVVVSTFLTLFVVPCAYSLFARLERKPKEAPIPVKTHTEGRKSPDWKPIVSGEGGGAGPLRPL